MSNVHWAAVYREHRAQWGVTRVRLPKRSECSKGSPYSQDIVRQALSSDSDLIQKVLCTALCPALTWVAPRLQLPRDNTIFLLLSSLLLPCLGQTKFSSALNGQHTSALDTIALTSADEEKNNAGFSPPRSFLLGDTGYHLPPLHVRIF